MTFITETDGTQNTVKDYKEVEVQAKLRGKPSLKQVHPEWPLFLFSYTFACCIPEGFFNLELELGTMKFPLLAAPLAKTQVYTTDFCF